MRFSKFFTKTRRQIPSDEETPGAKLLVKAGFVSKLASGLYNYLPLGLMVLKKIKKTIGIELGKASACEILTPVLHPAKFWQDSGRFDEVGPELWKIKNASGDDFVLAMTAEEVVSEIAKNNIQSYKDLPVIFNQFQTKIRNEVRPRGGLLRVKEFIMQDAYSFDKDEKGMDASHDKIYKAYEKIFKIFDLKTIPVEADVGAMGGSDSYEFMVKNSAGEDKIVLCEKCGYAANLEKAECFIAIEPDRVKKEDKEKVKTPRMLTVEEVAEYLKSPEENVLKTMVYQIKGKGGKNGKSGKKFVIAVIRGDLSLNQKKLENALGGVELEKASEKAMEAVDMVPGFVSPIDLDAEDIKVVADNSVKFMTNFIAGANERDYHFTNVNVDDFEPNIWADLIQVSSGSRCEKCGEKLKIEKAIEVGHTFKLGTKYSKSLGVKFTDTDGKEKPVFMGCYGIGLGRALAAIAEEHFDENGLIWPASVAPFKVYLINISDLPKADKIAEKVYKELMDVGFEVLYDDRDLSAGVKFGDCDLIGVPVRLVVSQKTMIKNSVEIKIRDSKKTSLVKISDLQKELKKLMK